MLGKTYRYLVPLFFSLLSFAVGQVTPDAGQKPEEKSESTLGGLSTERPGFTSSSAVVGTGILQLEQGYRYSTERTDVTGVNVWNLPESLVRFGISEMLELRFSSNGYTWQASSPAVGRGTVSGPNDFGVALKARLRKQYHWKPEFSITAGFSIPAHGSAFTSSGYDPSVTLAATKDLPGKVTLEVNSILSSVTRPNGRYFSDGESVWVTRPTKLFSPFGEVFRTSLGWREGSQMAVDGGLFRGIGKNVQVDAAVGRTIGGSQPGWFVITGIVVRNPYRLMMPGWFHAN